MGPFHVYTQASFDILHAGHIKLLKKCKRLGRVTVSLLSDSSYEKYRGYKPAVPFTSRREVIKGLKYVDEVIEGDNTRTKLELLALKPDIVVVGTDWAKKDIYKQYGVTQEWLDEHNILLLFFPYTTGISSTDIKKRCKK